MTGRSRSVLGRPSECRGAGPAMLSGADSRDADAARCGERLFIRDALAGGRPPVRSSAMGVKVSWRSGWICADPGLRRSARHDLPRTALVYMLTLSPLRDPSQVI